MESWQKNFNCCRWLFLIFIVTVLLLAGCFTNSDKEDENIDTADSTGLEEALQDSLEAYQDSIAAADSLKAWEDSIATADSLAAWEDSIATADSLVAWEDSVRLVDSVRVADSLASLQDSLLIIRDPNDSTKIDTLKVTDPLVLDLSGTSTVDSSGEGFLITLERESECIDGVLETREVTDTTYYEIEDGKLYTWQEGDCSKVIYTGNNPTLIGTWETSFETEPLVDLTCRDEENIQQMLPYMLNPRGTATITETEVRFVSSTAVCMAPFFADQIIMEEGLFGPEEGNSSGGVQNLRVEGCSDIFFTTSIGSIEGIPVAMHMEDKDGDELIMDMTLGNCTVSQVLPKFEATEENCRPQEDATDDSVFQTCFMEWVFENTCFVDGVLQEMAGDTSLSPDISITKVDCRTLEFLLPMEGSDTVSAIVTYFLEEGQLFSTTTSENCSFTGGVDENAFEDETFSTCVEQQLEVPPPMPRFGSREIRHIPTHLNRFRNRLTR